MALSDVEHNVLELWITDLMHPLERLEFVAPGFPALAEPVEILSDQAVDGCDILSLPCSLEQGKGAGEEAFGRHGISLGRLQLGPHPEDVAKEAPIPTPSDLILQALESGDGYSVVVEMKEGAGRPECDPFLKRTVRPSKSAPRLVEEGERPGGVIFLIKRESLSKRPIPLGKQEHAGLVPCRNGFIDGRHRIVDHGVSTQLDKGLPDEASRRQHAIRLAGQPPEARVAPKSQEPLLGKLARRLAVSVDDGPHGSTVVTIGRFFEKPPLLLPDDRTSWPSQP